MLLTAQFFIESSRADVLITVAVIGQEILMAPIGEGTARLVAGDVSATNDR
jgi:hypothetical protein